MTISAVYPEGVAPALGHLNTAGNDIQIFVEDTAARNMWVNILKKFLPEGARFSGPIQLGGRGKVLEECRLDQADDGRKRLYIIDADLDILKGQRKPRLKNLYRLRTYCIENYLLQEKALLKVAQNLDVNVSESEARRRLDFAGWKQRNQYAFTQLFICYATVHSIEDSHQTVGFYVGSLSKPTPYTDEMCPVATRRRTHNLFKCILGGPSKAQVRRVFSEIKANAATRDYFEFVSAKDYILKQILVRMKREFGQMSDERIKVLISDHISTSIDPYLARRLKKIMR